MRNIFVIVRVAAVAFAIPFIALLFFSFNLNLNIDSVRHNKIFIRMLISCVFSSSSVGMGFLKAIIYTTRWASKNKNSNITIYLSVLAMAFYNGFSAVAELAATRGNCYICRLFLPTFREKSIKPLI